MWKEIIDKNLIVIHPEVKDKNDLFEGMVNHVYNHDYIRNKKKFIQALQDREKMANTELMPGVALPHTRSNTAEKLFVCIIILKKGIDYDNEEMGPVKLIFFFGCPEKHNKQYLQLLAQSSRLLKNEEFRKMLLKSKDKQDVIDILLKHDEQIEKEEDSDRFMMLMMLNEVENKSDVYSALVEVGITNASIVESSSLAQKIAFEMPVFAGLRLMSHHKSSNSLMIISHLQNKKTANKLANLLQQYKIDLNKQGVGFIQLIKVEKVIGNFNEEIEM